MYTQCPECLSVFSLDVQTLAQAHGFVQCGHCSAGFDSIATLAEHLPPEPFDELMVNEPGFEPPCLDLVVYRPRPAPPAVAPVDVIDTAPASGDAAEDFSQLVFAPRFAREARARRKEKPRRPSRHLRGPGERRWPWIVACSLFALVLAAQLGWAKRDLLLRDDLSGGWLRSVCGTFGCSLPLVASPGQLRLLASNVQAHPSVAGALMISASVQNEAPFAQPYPVLKITLSDAQGKRIAMRRLQPDEYLDDEAVRRRGLAPGARAVLLLELEDPGARAVGFELGFE